MSTNTTAPACLLYHTSHNTNLNHLLATLYSPQTKMQVLQILYLAFILPSALATPVAKGKKAVSAPPALPPQASPSGKHKLRCGLLDVVSFGASRFC
jgi:hypothetical protein